VNKTLLLLTSSLLLAVAPAAYAKGAKKPTVPAAPALPPEPETVILLANKPGSTVELVPVAKGAHLKNVADGSTAKASDFVAGGPLGTLAITFEGAKYFVTTANYCVVAGTPRADGARFLACDPDEGDLPHANLWYVPSLAKRVQLTTAGTEQQGYFASTPAGPTVVVADGIMYVIDATTNEVAQIEGGGAPSWNQAGVLHYRMLDGTAWKYEAGTSTKLGKGRRGKASKGDLNSGFEPTVWPAAVTFGRNDKPKWK